MSIQTSAMKNLLATEYGTNAAYGAVYTDVPSSTAGTEPTGGSPAYARKALTWSGPTNGVTSASATFDIPASTTIAGAGLHSAATAGTYYDGASVTSQPFASQGTYSVTFQYTQG